MAGSLRCCLGRLYIMLLCCCGVTVVGVYLQSGILYPVVVRFGSVNYAGVSTNNYGLNEVEPA
jgi:Photosystem I reaction centre subunit IV / PsaE